MLSSAVQSRVRLNTDELHQLKWLLGQFISLIAIWALFGLEMSAEPVLLAFSLMLIASMLWPGLPSRLPETFWKFANPLLIVFIIGDFVLHGVEFLKPMVRMVMLLTIFRAFQYRKAREDLQLVLLCLFTLVVKGVMTVSLLFAFQMLIFTPAAMALLFLINLLETSKTRLLGAEDFKHFRWSRFLSRLAHGLDFRLIAFAGGLFVGLVSISSLIFVLMPRFRMDQALPFLQIEGSGKIGFSEHIKIGDVNSLSADDSIALRVQVPDLDNVPSRPFWRMVVLDEYRDGAFQVSNSLKQAGRIAMEGTMYPERLTGRATRSIEDDWVFYLEGDTSRYLPLLGSFDVIRFAKKAKFWPYIQTEVIMLEQVPSNVFGYSVSGMRPSDRIPTTNADRAVLDNTSGPIPQPRGKPPVAYPLTTLVVPNNPEINEYLQGVVDELTQGEVIDAHEFSQRARVWLAENYTYDTQTSVTQVEGDPLIAWMQDAKRGWCEHFTGAYVLLCRTAGFPTRAIAGFAGANWNDYEDYLIVNNSFGHAWAETYDGQGNWFRVDPTPAAGIAGLQSLSQSVGSIQTIAGWSAWVDSLRMVWYRRVVNFDQSDQIEMADDIKNYSVAFYESFKRELLSYWNDFKQWLLSGWDREKIIRILLTISIFCFGIIAIRSLWVWLRKLASRSGTITTLMGGDPIRKRAGKLLVKFRPVWARSEGRLNSEEKQRWRGVFEHLERLRFGPAEERPDHKKIFREVKKLMRQEPKQG
ncbi:transglutaminaseTgpA domain-containing protein [Rubellicoccus peritrichatus]|uniref:TransglutaminaseTgpA domain-containing protein n=1 Tax=Rubellicoccus peritrichatus TaxID=3080537 RepID=A0AAQ3QVJ9_9BACT|nr:transglutaminaseTgpA domain-containing protein [Puniceicoccus sp. CR14]WOO40980.1 transglutaminaseTgpA domain-containing protein [Puniceicoccus sp. CR14]